MSNNEASRSARRSIPAGIWALGFVSMLMDISSEMIHAPLPIYMVTVLGTLSVWLSVLTVLNNLRHSAQRGPRRTHTCILLYSTLPIMRLS